MAWLENVLGRRRLILTIAALLSLTGLAAWMTMVRQEDPQMPAYWGQAVVVYPGADAEMVERLVLEPMEDALAEVDEVKVVQSTAYAETAVLAIDLIEGIDDTNAAWDDVRRALARAQMEFPEGVGEPMLNDEMSTDHEAVVVAVTGSPEPTELLEAARTVREALLDVPQVARVKIIGDPGEQVTISLDDAAARRLGVSAGALAAQLGARARNLPGGTLAFGDRTVRVRPMSEMESVAEIRATPIRLPSGATVPLGEVATVRFGQVEPVGERMRLDGEMAVGLGVVAKKTVNAVTFGEAVQQTLDEAARDIAPLELHRVAFQPDRVEHRLSQLNQSLLLGILIVAGVVIMAMGLRLGLVVASVVPLVTFAALAFFAIGGGVLHQISIAALVLALGMLVDNAIVMAENIQWRLDRGVPRATAAGEAVRELAVPLAAATGTTIAAFMPMLLAESGTADFTRSIPVMLILTLSISYVFAVFVTPILAQAALRPGSSRATAFTDRLGAIVAGVATRRTGLVLVAALLLVVGSGIGSGMVRQQFFPAADRNQFVVDLKLPEGAHLDATDRASRTLERALEGRDEVVQVASFMGRGAPRFYYNIQSVPWSPHFAQIVVNTRTTADVEPMLTWLRAAKRDLLPGVEIIGRRLEQGPPVGAPVEIRLFSDELEQLSEGVNLVAGALREIDLATDVRHDLGPGEPTLRVVIDDAAAARVGLSRADVAMALYGQTRGLPVGQLRTGEDPVPIVVRSSAGERLDAEVLQVLDVAAPDGSVVPLAQVARIEAQWRPAAIHHRGRERIATVSSQLAPGAAFSDVALALQPKLEAMDLPDGVRVAYGGDAEGAGEANTAMLRTLPIGLLMLLGVLLAEFNSFRRVAIILVTVPLAATGVVPGLLLSGQPFGFMSLLGVFALVGIVVNNAIVLLEVVDTARREGASLDEALTAGIQQRIRPILLTTATTVAGLLPLALSPSTLWPPLAWAMISGLLASTVLTLAVVPALYRVLFRPVSGWRLGFRSAAPAAAVLAALVLVPLAGAEEARTVGLTEVMRLGMERPAAQAASLRAERTRQEGLAERRLSYLPVVGASASISDRDRDLELVTPIGAFPFGDSRTTSAGIRITQPLFDPAAMLHGNAASRLEADADDRASRRTLQLLAARAAQAHLQVLDIEARQASTRAFVDSLTARLEEMQARVDAGRALEADALKIRQSLERAELELLGLSEAHATALLVLAQAVGANGRVEPQPVADWTDRPSPEAEAALNRALERRTDLQALDLAEEALERRRAAVKASALPRVDASAAWSWTDGSPYSEDQWIEGGLMLSWTPFASNTRAAQAAAVSAERDAVARDALEARRSLNTEIQSALAVLATARDAVEVGRRGIEQATETLRVERERHAAGRSTTNDLLDAEAVLREQRTLFEIAKLEVVSAWVDLWLVTGSDDPEELVAGLG
jgi:multidrug efflux pump subunit AcrB/outer membrane protein TolC